MQKETDKDLNRKLADDEMKKISGGIDPTMPETYFLERCQKCGRLARLDGDLLCDKCRGGSCVAAGTLILMSDGTTKPVENVKSHDLVASWDFDNGALTSAEILYNAHLNQSAQKETVIALRFSDGSKVSIVKEHGFFDLTLGKFVTLDKNAAAFVGHEFVHIHDAGFCPVELTEVSTHEESLCFYSPIAKGTLCLFTDGILSVADCLPMFMNSFDVDRQTLTYTGKGSDIAKYGLLEYGKVKHLVSKEAYDAFGGQYMGIAIGKGDCSMAEIEALLQTYAEDLKMMTEVLR